MQTQTVESFIAALQEKDIEAISALLNSGEWPLPGGERHNARLSFPPVSRFLVQWAGRRGRL